MADAPRRATIIDVAARAGVSRQTVTRAINDMSGISAGTRERVLEAAHELAYRPSRFGRGLVEQGSITLGVAVKDLANTYFAELGAAMVRAGARHDWSVVLAESGNAPRPDEAAAQLARRVDALVGYDVLPGTIRGGIGMPVVHLDGRADDRGEVGVVEIAAGEAMADLAEHLGAVGVRRPAVIDLDEGEPSRRARDLAAALATVHEVGEVPIYAAQAREGHRELLEEVLATGPDALVAFNDELAVRVLRALRMLDVDVPGQVRLVGVDGLEISALVSPELTTLTLDLDEVARRTVELVAGMLDGSLPLQGPSAHRIVPYRLERRAST